MSEKIDFRTVDTARQIRDRQAELLAGRSDKELIDFFARAGEMIRKQTRDITRAQPAQGRSAQGGSVTPRR